MSRQIDAQAFWHQGQKSSFTFPTSLVQIGHIKFYRMVFSGNAPRGNGPPHGLARVKSMACFDLKKAGPLACHLIFSSIKFHIMFLKIKNGWAGLALLGLFLAVFSLQANNLPTHLAPADCSCDAPGNVVKTGQTDSSVSFSWGAVAGATDYKVWYVRIDDNYTSAQTTATGTSINYSGLPTGRYVFYFSTNCGGETSSIIIMEDIMMG